MINKSVFLSLLVIGVVAAAAGAGTWASYMDTEGSAGNTFTAGTMNLAMNTIDGAVGGPVITVVNVVPGDTDEPAGSIEFLNDGNTAGYLTLTVSDIANYENGLMEPETNDLTPADDATTGELGDVLEVTVSDDTTTYTGTLDALGDMYFGEVAAETTKTITVTYSVADAVGNEIQSDSVEFTINAELDQLSTV